MIDALKREAHEWLVWSLRTLLVLGGVLAIMFTRAIVSGKNYAISPVACEMIQKTH